jgi:glycosyltransferase involved in cell wall biosynthesis
MPSAPAVGVVVANHNNCAFVAKAIESVARQTVRDISVVVVDDASTDQSDEIIRACLATLDDPRFRYVRLESNLGQAGAVRRGLMELDTPFVCFLDSDDLWYDDFIARHLAVHMNTDFPVAMTYCDCHVIDAQDRLLAGTAWWFDSDPSPPAHRPVDPATMPSIDPQTGKLTYAQTHKLTLHMQWSPAGATNSTASMMFRRSFVDLVFVPPSPELRLYVDFYLSTFACLLTGAIAIHDALYGYRMHGNNKHSNAAVLGGAYNSSTQPWDPIRNSVLHLIQRVLRSEARAIRTAFGEERHTKAEALVAAALGELEPDATASPNGWNLERIFARASDLIGGDRPARPAPQNGTRDVLQPAPRRDRT